METLKNLNKFWRTSALLPATTTPAGTYSDVAASEEDVEVDVELEEEEEEESFFELELEMRNCCRNETTTTNESSRLSSKVVPIEPDLKTHSPISILKSAPKFKVSLFRKPKTELLDFNSFMAARPMVFVFVFLILISVHQIVPLAMAAPVSKHAPTHPISSVSHAGRGIIVGGSTSGLGGGGGKKPRKVMQLRGFEGRKLPEYEAGGSCSRLGGSGYHDCSP